MQRQVFEDAENHQARGEKRRCRRALSDAMCDMFEFEKRNVNVFRMKRSPVKDKTESAPAASQLHAGSNLTSELPRLGRCHPSAAAGNRH